MPAVKFWSWPIDLVTNAEAEHLSSIVTTLNLLEILNSFIDNLIKKHPASTHSYFSAHVQSFLPAVNQETSIYKYFEDEQDTCFVLSTHYKRCLEVQNTTSIDDILELLTISRAAKPEDMFLSKWKGRSSSSSFSSELTAPTRQPLIAKGSAFKVEGSVFELPLENTAQSSSAPCSPCSSAQLKIGYIYPSSSVVLSAPVLFFVELSSLMCPLPLLNEITHGIPWPPELQFTSLLPYHNSTDLVSSDGSFTWHRIMNFISNLQTLNLLK